MASVMKELLQGRRVGFAPRPLLGGVVVGVGLGATLLDLMAWFEWGTRSTNGLAAGAHWLVAAAALLTLITFAAAVAESLDLLPEDARLGRLDLAALALAALLYATSAMFRAADPGAAAAAPLPFLLAIGALLVLLIDAVIAATLYASREWEELEPDVAHNRRPAKRAAAR